MRLLADVGGTNTRCALQRPGGTPERIRLYRNDAFPALEAVVEAYLDAEKPAAPPRVAAIAVAAPVDREPLLLTNRRWRIDRERLGQLLGIASVHLMNDFAALALALPCLDARELVPIGRVQTPADHTRAVLGPGTGLGMAGLLRHGSGWIPVPGEGGHTTMPACDAFEMALIERLRQRHGGHVSAERVLSGPGLSALHEALAVERGLAAPAMSPEQVCAAAGAGDPLPAEALDVWLAMLGTVAGDLALWMGARGGVYLAGGILPRLAPHLAASRFRERFEDKGRYRTYLSAVPTLLITATTPALAGLAAYLDECDRRA